VNSPSTLTLLTPNHVVDEVYGRVPAEAWVLDLRPDTLQPDALGGLEDVHIARGSIRAGFQRPADASVTIRSAQADSTVMVRAGGNNQMLRTRLCRRPRAVLPFQLQLPSRRLVTFSGQT